MVAQLQNAGLWHGRYAILFCPGLDGKSHLIEVFLLGWEDFVQ